MKQILLFLLLMYSFNLVAQVAENEVITSVVEEGATSVVSQEISEPDLILNSSAFTEMLKTTPSQVANSRYAKQLRTAERLNKTGKILTLVGAPILVVSTAGFLVALNDVDLTYYMYDDHRTGDIGALGVFSAIGMFAGGIMLEAGIPLWITGSIMKKNTLKAINAREYSYHPTYRFGVTESGGVGLAINF